MLQKRVVSLWKRTIANRKRSTYSTGLANAGAGLDQVDRIEGHFEDIQEFVQTISLRCFSKEPLIYRADSANF